MPTEDAVSASVDDGRANSLLAGPGHTWYLALGSMTNPTSLALRDIHPIRSMPATVRDFRLQFTWRTGFPHAFGDAQPAAGWQFDGVLHLVTDAQVAILDTIEVGYRKLQAIATTYTGDEVSCFIYSFHPLTVGSGRPETAWLQPHPVEHIGDLVERCGYAGEDAMPPSQRYLELIIEGCKHYGVHSEHIAMLRRIPFCPRKTPSEFASMPVPQDCPVWTREMVAAADYRYGVLNGKILFWTGATGDQVKEYQLWKNRTKVKHIELSWCRLLYDPKYGVHDKIEEFPREHCCYIEDVLSEWERAGWIKVVGITEQACADG